MIKNKNMKANTFRRLINLWPPLLGAGIHVKTISNDFRDVIVEMKLRSWNRNYVGSHYGGSLFSMTDPFYALILIKNLGPDYVIVDKASSIQFKKPGHGKLTAHFNVTKERLDEIRKQADTLGKIEPEFTINITDEAGDVVAEVGKTVYVRRKDKKPKEPTA